MSYLRIGVLACIYSPHRAYFNLEHIVVSTSSEPMVDRFAKVIFKAKPNWVSLVTCKSAINHSSKRQ